MCQANYENETKPKWNASQVGRAAIMQRAMCPIPTYAPSPCFASGCCRCWSDYDRQRQRASVSAFADNVDGANRCNSHLPPRQIVASRRHSLALSLFLSLSLFRHLICIKWKLIRSLEMISRCEAHCRGRRMRRGDSTVQGRQTEWRLVQEGSRQLTDPM